MSTSIIPTSLYILYPTNCVCVRVLSYWRLLGSSGLRVCTSPGWGTSGLLSGAARSSPSFCVLQKVGGRAILPRLTATDGIASKQRLCASVVPLSTTAAPKAAPHSHSPIISFICLCIRFYRLTHLHLHSDLHPYLLHFTLQRSSVPARFCALRYRQSQYPSGPANWLVRSSCCHRPRAAPRHRHLRIFAPAQRPTNPWPQRGSGCLLRASICERKTTKNHYATSALCSSLKVAKVAPVVCVADRKEAEAWCLPLSYSSSCHCLHSQLSERRLPASA